MEELMAVCIVGIATLGVYKFFDLVIRRKERMAIIEKLSFGENCKFPVDFDFSLFQKKKNPLSTLKIALLLIGIGLGLVVAFSINLFVYANIGNEFHYVQNRGVIYIASIMLFGGLGLLIAYFIESKKDREK